MKSPNKRAFLEHGILMPLIVLVILLFILYAIIDTQLRYGSFSDAFVIVSAILVFLGICFTLRFQFIHYEYSIVGDALIIRRIVLRRITQIHILRFDSMRSVKTKKYRFGVVSLLKPRGNLCNSFSAALFKGCVMVYAPEDAQGTHNHERTAIIEPPDEVKRLLKLNLNERYSCV